MMEIEDPGSDWTGGPRMHPNGNYYKLFDIQKLPAAPERADSISVGVITAVARLSVDSGLYQRFFAALNG
ncbi:MAG: hypothetical protein K6E30_02525 [Lachnospiraceae bacterium]|nr:hypothetical protein [Lachnospiraceae bacterium]